MSPDDKLSEWADHAVAPDDPPEPSPEHLDSADGALTKLFGGEVTPDVTMSRLPPPPDSPPDPDSDPDQTEAEEAEPQGDAAPGAGAGAGAAAAGGTVLINADPVTGPLPIVDLAPLDEEELLAEEQLGQEEELPVDGDELGAPLAGDDTRSRRDRHRDWRRTEKARRLAARKSVRFPIFTRSVLLWMLVFALVGFAFGASGAFWWANFNSRVSDIEQSQNDFESRSLDAQASIEKMRQDALTQINDAVAPLQAFLSESQMLQFGQLLSPSVYEVATLDDQGLPSAGAAFGVIEAGDSTYFVTSYATVKAATVAPGPQVSIRKGGEDIKAEVWNWDPARDLALIKAPKAGVTLLDWVTGNEAAGAVGSRVFPVSGTGGSGASLTSGLVIDQSADGIQHTAPLAPQFQGGPIVDVAGKVVAIASLTYAPLGFSTGPQIHFAVPIDQVCQRLISCSGGGARTPAAQGG